MIVKYVVPLLAVLGAGLAVVTVLAQQKKVVPAPPVAQPAPAPYAANVPGAGLVEPSTENIAIGTNIAGVATKVLVKAGDRVKAGDPLFTIDDRAQRAELAMREAAVQAAEAQVGRLTALPRAEDIPPAEARLVAAESDAGDQDAKLRMVETVTDKRAVSAEELSIRRFAVLSAKARLAEARAQVDLLKAGAWKPELDIARANLASAKSDADRVRTEIERLTIRAPVDADVLKVNIRPGEFAQAGFLQDPLLVLGETKTMHIRVDVDENDAWRVAPGSPGIAYVRGNSALSTEIRFVRFEPYVIPKRSLTGASSERVDTRVLQVIYEFDHAKLPMVYVGQQMDVFIKSEPIGNARFGVDPERAAHDLEGAGK